MIRWIHRISLAGIVFGMGLVVQPFWPHGLRAGFFVTLVATVVYIVASHLSSAEEP